MSTGAEGGRVKSKRLTLLQRASREADSYRPDFESIGIPDRNHHLLIQFMKQVYMKAYRRALRDSRKKGRGK